MRNILFVPYQDSSYERLTVPKLAELFLSHGFEVILVQLNNPIPNIPNQCKVIIDTGWKFELAFKYLWDEKFDNLFLWDSDIDPLNFNPTLFIKKMEKFWLDTAHPTLSDDSFQDWNNGFSNKEVLNKSFNGRYMSYLPIMCLTYSYRGWLILKSVLGRKYKGELWSYGFAMTGNKGFIDTMEVRHIRPVTPRESESESFKIMNNNMNDAYDKCGVQHPCFRPHDWLELGRF